MRGEERGTRGEGVARRDLQGAGLSLEEERAPAAEPSPRPSPLAPHPELVESLVIQTSFLGDTVLTTPLIAELATRGPVDVVVTPAAAPLLANNPAIRNLVLYDKRGEGSGVRGLWRTSSALRGRRREPLAGRWRRRERRAARTAYMAQGSVRSAMLALLGGYGARVGFTTSAGRALYTHCVLFRDDRHHAERLWRLAFPQQPTVEPPPGALHPRLFPGDVERAAADQVLRDVGDGTAFVVLAPGSVWATKRWPYYAELAGRLTRRYPVVLVGGVRDTDAAREIVERAGRRRVLDAVGKLSLLASAELIGRAAVLVTNDSAPLHLASAMDTPTVAIFGPTVPEFGFGPLAPRSAVVGQDALSCRPCHRHGPSQCPLGHWRCMRELDVDSVEALITSILT